MAPSVPNVKPKSDPLEAKRLQAMMGNAREQNAQLHLGEEDVVLELENKVVLKEDGGLDLKSIPTVYIKNCKNCSYTLKHRVSKILVEGCENVNVVIEGKVMTATLEAWKCNGLKLSTSTPLKTFQVDMCKGVEVTYAAKDNFGCIVWQDVEDMSVKVEGSEKEKYEVETGFAQMKIEFPDSEPQLDQYIIRFVEELGDKLSSERCVRLANGFLSTEREAAEWEKRNNLAKDRYMEKFIKEAGIRLNKKSDAPSVGRNEPCFCRSGKKFKKCCMNKKELTGLSADNPESVKTYLDEAKK